MVGDVGVGGSLMALMVTTLQSSRRNANSSEWRENLVLREDLMVRLNALVSRCNIQSQVAANRETS